jgi:starch synthase (maltosyl-transferring)
LNGKSIAPYIAKLNQIRRENPALQQLRNVSTHWSDDSEILVYSKHIEARFTQSGEANTIIVVANVDPHAVRSTTVHLDLAKLGMPYGSTFEVVDLLSGDVFTWSADNYVKLDAFVNPVHILRVSKIK